MAVEDNNKYKIVPMKIPESLKREFPEPKSQFPQDWKGVRFIGGRTLVKIGKFHKAAILVQNSSGLQLRLYGWTYTKKEKWWAQQKFYATFGTANKLLAVLDAFIINSPKNRKSRSEDP